MHRLAVLLVLAFAAVSASAANTTARLLLSHTSAKPGETVWAGVLLQMAPKWHTYWENGGDSGAATKVDWTLPAGITAGEILWPVPEKYEAAGLITYVYHDEIVLLIPLSVAPSATAGKADLSALASWLECSELCLPAKSKVAASLTIGTESVTSPQAARIEAAKKALPQPKPSSFAKAWWESAADGDKRPLLIEWPVTAGALESDFFPHTSTNVTVSASTEFVATNAGTIRLRKQVEKLGATWPSEIAGVIVQREPGAETLSASFIKLAIGDTSSATPSSTPSALGNVETKSLFAWLAYAFLGGLILNVMPCVLPVIALKILGFVSQSRENPKRVRTLGLLYTLGVLVSFLILSGIIIGLRLAGQKAGWGIQFSNPQFVIVLAVVVTLVALNLFGVFEVTLGGGALDAASEAASRHGGGGAFMNGVLATVLATPCTAPFLGAALGFASVQPAPVIVLFFLTIGLGLAFPYLLLSWNPTWLKFLPKPGAWMERFKVAMGFPMLATALWLWCLTCNVSVKPALESKAVLEKLAGINALGLVADYTSYSPVISAELERFGRGGVPLVVVYPADASQPPLVLPEPLPYPAPYTPTILEALGKAVK
ncbi:MAG: hypothetical protein IPK15_11865 [Verrucomicrobia bacterium]|nr:hypothetical protein [Verrucomicrobiota bacterium]